MAREYRSRGHPAKQQHKRKDWMATSPERLFAMLGAHHLAPHRVRGDGGHVPVAVADAIAEARRAGSVTLLFRAVAAREVEP